MQQITYSSAAAFTGEFANNGVSNRSRAATDQYEYRLVIYAGNQITQQLSAEKKAFFDRYKSGIDQKDEPSITVIRFMATEEMEPTISKWIQRICSQQESFIVTLNNYSGYPPNNIHVRVQYTQAFQRLGKELKVIDNYVKSYGLVAATITSHPHLTLARSVPEEVYSKAMFDFAKRDFHASFIVSELILLKRKHQFEESRKISVFGLIPGMAVTTRNEPLITF